MQNLISSTFDFVIDFLVSDYCSYIIGAWAIMGGFILFQMLLGVRRMRHD